MNDWHTLPISEVFKRLKTSPKGLSEEEVRKRLQIYGYNVFKEKKKRAIIIFINQFKSILILILIIAAIISFFLGSKLDALSIIAIVILMGLMGFIQEFRAERALEKLKAMTTPQCTVIRNGKEKTISITELVPGDIVLLNEGDKVPADIRLFETENLEIDESSLTGESIPVEKNANIILSKDTPVAERKNMAFMGTYVTKGKGKGVVVATGMQTEIGKIAKFLLEAKEEKTPLEIELDKFGKRIGIILIIICLIVFFSLTFIAKERIIEALLLSIALAVAAVPEGLPAITTVILTLGAWRMVKRNALVRRLAAIETLGSCNVICVDKTGTITKGEMTVRQIFTGNRLYKVTGIGYEPRGEIIELDEIKKLKPNKALEFLLKCCIIHNVEEVSLIKEDNQWKIKGPPTPGAALVLGYKAFNENEINKLINKYPVVRTLPFDRFRKRRSTIHKVGNRFLVIVSGAPEVLLNQCTKILLDDGSEKPLTKDERNRIIQMINNFASRGFRTYAFAYRYFDNMNLEKVTPETAERELTFLGLLGIIDPPREGVKDAIKVCKRAGIKIIMITGDHKLTAMSIAKEIGLEVSEDKVLEGRDLDSMEDKELEKIVDKVTVYARVTPEHKARIVKLLKKKGYIVAMTGDGVNDAPALKLADIGVAMGIRGTEVAKEAADLILLDDNFVTIVEAVKEGRVIFENLKKPINYLLTCNFGEILTIFGSAMIGLPEILKPIHLLWINITTDALPAIALGLEPAEPGLMERPPRRKDEGIITNRKIIYYIVMGTILAILTILFFSLALSVNLTFAQTVAFTMLALSEFGRALSSRSEINPIWKLPNNKWLWPALLVSTFLQLMVIYIPPLTAIFHTTPIPPYIVPLIILATLIIFVIDEVRKLLKIRI